MMCGCGIVKICKLNKPMTNKKYNIIYADPPWSYNDKLLGKSGACNKYDVMEASVALATL